MEWTWENLDRLMRRLPDPALFIIGLAIIAGITAFKVTLGQSIPLVDFLLIPVVWVGWFAQKRSYGYVLAFAAAAASAVVAVIGVTQASLGAACTSALARFALYLFVLALLGMMRRERAGHQRDATTDQQTGAANARALRTLAAAEVARSQRSAHSLSLAYLDLDDFKAINDTLGHAEGDHVLFEVGHMMRTSVRATDSVARVGGDEFAILMPETGAKEARTVVERVRRELDRLTARDGRHVLFSIGLVTFDRPPASVDELTSAADELMYRAKHGGKDRVEQAERAGTFLALAKSAPADARSGPAVI
jgi:diguanylate cyclase (GGDEF)-like protein